MPFPWYNPDVPASHTNAPQKTEHMYLEELTQRAALLFRLGYTKDETKLRLRGNVYWDFELHTRPLHLLEQIDPIVQQMFQKRGFGGAAPSSLD